MPRKSRESHKRRLDIFSLSTYTFLKTFFMIFARGLNWRKAKITLDADDRGYPLSITLRNGSKGRSWFLVRLAVIAASGERRASGVSVVRLSISPGKSTEMENEIAVRARARVRTPARAPAPTPTRARLIDGVRETRDLSTLSVLRSFRCIYVGSRSTLLMCFNNENIMCVQNARRAPIRTLIIERPDRCCTFY